MSTFHNFRLLPPEPLNTAITASDGYSVSLADGYSFVTPWVDTRNFGNYSFTITMTGTFTGSLLLQSSNEQALNDPWGNIVGSNPPSAQGVAALSAQPAFGGLDAATVSNTTTSITGPNVTVFDSGLLYISQPACRWFRVVYTGTAGTGKVVIWFNAKKF